MPQRSRVSLYLDTSIKDALEEQAKLEDRSLSNLIEIILRKHIDTRSDEKREKKKGHLRYPSARTVTVKFRNDNRKNFKKFKG